MEFSDMIGPIAGGALIGLGATLSMLLSGRIAGVSGIAGGLTAPKAGDVGWRVAFVGGLMIGGATMFALRPEIFASVIEPNMAVIAIGGLLVGFGSRMGSGCTSGHGVCGVARSSPRSLVATLTFVASGAIATFFARHVIGGAL